MRTAFIALLLTLCSINAPAQINAQFIKEFKMLISAKQADIKTGDTASYTNGIVAYKSKMRLAGYSTYYLEGIIGISVHAKYLQKASNATVDSILNAISDMRWTIVDSKTNAGISEKMSTYTEREVSVNMDETKKYTAKITLSKSGDLSIMFSKREGW